ncbi:Cysteine-rich receptor-like protein kinase 10 [Hordeum vulgare]|nr:Cysteine-rich receptor-like protein kinase 10 [Hordeum vulgare]
MESTTSLSSCGFDSHSRSSGSSTLLPVKPEREETPLGRRTRSVAIVINEPRASSSRLMRPKTEPVLLPVKHEHLAMPVDNETALKWVRDDYVREEMEHQRRALKEIVARRHGREEGGIVILDKSDEEAPAPARLGDPVQGRSKDGAPAGGNGYNDDNDYTAFYKLLSM